MIPLVLGIFSMYLFYVHFMYHNHVNAMIGTNTDQRSEQVLALHCTSGLVSHKLFDKAPVFCTEMT